MYQLKLCKALLAYIIYLLIKYAFPMAECNLNKVKIYMLLESAQFWVYIHFILLRMRLMFPIQTPWASRDQLRISIFHLAYIEYHQFIDKPSLNGFVLT